TRYPGESLNLSVEVTAQPTPTYQWKKDGVAIASANSQSLYLPNLAASDAGDYTVTVTNSEGSVTSEAAVIDVDPLVAPVILRHPSSTSLLPGGYGSIDVQLLNPHGVTYQWKKDNEVLAGVTSSSYSFSSAGPAHAGK